MNKRIKEIINQMSEPKYWLILACIGVWMIVLQNFGVFGERSQTVYVVGGDIDARVRGSVDIDNSVDVNLQYINGRRDVFFNNPRRGDRDKYYVIPVTVE